jgi:hypothetical protein
MLSGVGIRDYAANVEPVVRPLLDDGERLLAAAPLVKNPGTTEDVDLADELKNLLDPTILLGLGTHPGNAMQQAMFGRAVTGARDSIARRLFEAVEAASAPKAAVTNQRLVIVEIDAVPRGTGFWGRWFGPSDLVGRYVHAVPRNSILGAIEAPAGVLRQGRILVGFVDGSGCVLVCSPPSLAGSVVRAIGAPRPDATGTQKEHS